MIRIFALVLLLNTSIAFAHQKTYEAVIRYPSGNTGHVTIEAPDWFTAKDQIQARYCGGIDCIIEGPF